MVKVKSHAAERGSSGKGSGTCKTKTRGKRKRIRIDDRQREVLELAFARNRYPTSSQYEAIAERAGLPLSSSKVWFQNRRRRSKLASATSSSSEVDPFVCQFNKLSEYANKLQARLLRRTSNRTPRVSDGTESGGEWGEERGSSSSPELPPLLRNLVEMQDIDAALDPLMESMASDTIAQEGVEGQIEELRMMQRLFHCKHKQKLLLQSQIMYELGHRHPLASSAELPPPISALAMPEQFMKGPYELSGIQKAVMLNHMLVLQSQQNTQLDMELQLMRELRQAQVDPRDLESGLPLASLHKERLRVQHPMIPSSCPTSASTSATNTPNPDNFLALPGAATAAAAAAAPMSMSPSVTAPPLSLPAFGDSMAPEPFSFLAMPLSTTSAGLDASSAMDLGDQLAGSSSSSIMNVMQGSMHRAEQW